MIEGQPCPLVSVVIPTSNGRSFLRDCLGALARQDYPSDRLEIIVVDNGSTDGTAAFLRQSFPSVHVLEYTEARGFAASCNDGARQATGEFVAFLNNDTRPDRRWLSELVERLERGRGRVCVASRILSWNGKRVDFVGGRLNFYGHGFQVDFGLPHHPDLYRVPRRTPFACGGAMAIDRDVFLDVGGFDEDYYAFFEDVDLGWRLWLLGYEVELVPSSIVYHRHHGTVKRMASAQRFFLYERNALYSIIKNYEEETLNKILPVALTLTQQRALISSGLDPSEVSHVSRYGTSKNTVRRGHLLFEPAVKVPLRTFSYLGAVDAVTRDMPRLQEKRAFVQGRRRRSDAEFFELFQDGLRDRNMPGRLYAEAHKRAVEELDRQGVLGRKRRRVLIVSHEAVGAEMAGPGIRSWEIAKALSDEFDVTLASPAIGDLPEQPPFAVVGYKRSDDQSLVSPINAAEVVIAFGYLTHDLPVLRHLDKPVVLDVYDPFLLENLEIHRSLPRERAREVNEMYRAILNQQFTCGDFYLCASERQRDFWLGLLTANGRVNPANYADDPTLRRLIDVVPFGLASDPPKSNGRHLKGQYPGINSQDPVILWGGGIWEWLDPLTLIRAVGELRQEIPNLRLFFMGKNHRDRNLVEAMPIVAEAERLSQGLGLTGTHVFFNDWVPYLDRPGYLLDADVGACLHREHVEAHFALRTRVLDYFWAGVPVLCTRGDSLSDYVATNDLGRVVGPEDVAEVRDALRDLLLDPEARSRRAPAFAAAREQYAWKRVVEPLVRFLREPTMASDRGSLVTTEADRETIVVDVEPTPAWYLPVKAVLTLARGGPDSLREEIDRFVRWKLGRP